MHAQCTWCPFNTDILSLSSSQPYDFSITGNFEDLTLYFTRKNLRCHSTFVRAYMVWVLCSYVCERVDGGGNREEEEIEKIKTRDDIWSEHPTNENILWVV